MGRDFEVWYGREERERFLEMQLRLRGIYPTEENPDGAYCPIPMTGVPKPIQEVLRSRGKTLSELILAPAGISTYSPATGLMSPDTNPNATFEEVYQYDARKIAANRFLVSLLLYPSFGVGTEEDIGLSLNRFSVSLFDKSIRTARMWPPCTIFLGYDNLEKQASRFSEVFAFMKKYSPALGMRDGKPILLGWPDKENIIVDMASEVYRRFPDLVYTHNPENPLPVAELKNPEIFYEYGPGASIKMERA
jgi:hypothetical protein